MYKALKNTVAHTDRRNIDLSIATQADLKFIYDLEEKAGCGHELVEKVADKEIKEAKK